MLLNILHGKINTVFSNITLSPNPARDIVQLKIGGADEAYSLSLYNLTGQKLWSSKVVTGNNKIVTIGLNDFSKGVYLLKIDKDLASRTIKIAKQ